MKKIISTLAATMMIVTSFSIPNSHAAYENYTEEEITKIDADLEIYQTEICDYAEKMGYSTDRFYFPNGHYYPIYTEDDLNWQEYHKRSTNIETVSVNLDYFIGNTQAGRCLGMSIASVLTHNSIISPSDIQEGKETLIDIEADTSFDGINTDPVIKSIISYHTRQLAPDFQLDMYYHFAHYDKEKEIGHLLETAKKATEQGKWWLMGYDDIKLSHAVAGIGLLEKEFKIGDETYDNCILTYDSNFVDEDTETGAILSKSVCSVYSCIFVNSETYNVFVPSYFLDNCTNENFKIYTLDDYDFMSYGRMIRTCLHKQNVV